MLKNNVKIAFRNISRQKVLSFINIFGLAIGMTVCILIFLWARNELSYDRFNKNLKNIYRVIQEGIWNDGSIYGNQTLPYRLTPVMQEIYPEVVNHVRLRYAGNMLMKTGDKEFYQNNVLFTEPALFEMFSFQWLAGDFNTAFDGTHDIILTKSTAHKYFGDENPLGKTICRNQNEIFTVTGICTDPPKNSSVWFTMIIPFIYLGDSINGWSWESIGYIQLQNNVDITSFKEKIRNTIIDHNPRGDTYVRIQPLSKAHLYGPLNEPSGITFVILFSVPFRNEWVAL
ncbi:MAG TPA: ABC transporter permease, partial [Candidatus Cloacimonadota bacterium]|nr:ABC transporter permease [Candidatus Cloacimonadota bacterium]